MPRPLRVLITNNTLEARAGSELYVRDLALALLKAGHKPIVYSTHLGEVAAELRRYTVPVVDNLEAVGQPPDVVHGHHHLDTLTALLHFPGVPAVYFCHGWIPWEEMPLKFPRILRYVAVDEVCLDRLVLEHGIPESQIRLILNFVDLERFKPRQPLPVRPLRALVFSNAASQVTQLPAIQEACRRAHLSSDVMGIGSGNACTEPEAILGQYDIVFAKARAAMEAMAVGCAVILCDAVGAGPMVTSHAFDRLRQCNFGIRTLDQPLTPEVLLAQIARYNHEDAVIVSEKIRAEAGIESTLQQVTGIYYQIIEEYAGMAKPSVAAESQAAARYFRWLSVFVKDRCRSEAHLHSQLNVCHREIAQLRESEAHLHSQLNVCHREIAQLREGSQQQLEHYTREIELLKQSSWLWLLVKLKRIITQRNK